jgi:DNA-binding NarL/FixJ family response regulator
MMRVLLADDQSRVRTALRILLERQPTLNIVGEATDAQELLAQVQACCPDVVLLDWELPGWNGNGAVKKLQAAQPGLAIIALSGRPEARQVALAAGVDTFVSKIDPPEQLLAALQVASLGKVVTNHHKGEE